MATLAGVAVAVMEHQPVSFSTEEWTIMWSEWTYSLFICEPTAKNIDKVMQFKSQIVLYSIIL